MHRHILGVLFLGPFRLGAPTISADVRDFQSDSSGQLDTTKTMKWEDTIRKKVELFLK